METIQIMGKLNKQSSGVGKYLKYHKEKVTGGNEIMKYTFDRYVDGQLRAQGIRIEKCNSLSAARKKAYNLNAQFNPEENVVLKLRKE